MENNCKHKLKANGKLRGYKDKEYVYCYLCEKQKDGCWVKCKCGEDAMMYSRRSDLFICNGCSLKGW